MLVLVWFPLRQLVRWRTAQRNRPRFQRDNFRILLRNLLMQILNHFLVLNVPIQLPLELLDLVLALLLNAHRLGFELLDEIGFLIETLFIETAHFELEFTILLLQSADLESELRPVPCYKDQTMLK